MSTRGSIALQLNRDHFETGQTLQASYQIDHEDFTKVKSIEVLVGWRTEGKGNVSTGSILGNFYEAGESDLDLQRNGELTVILPSTPLTYHGTLINVIWFVRVRAVSEFFKNLEAERSFRLGHVRGPS